MADMFSLGSSAITAGASLVGSKMTADATNKAARLNAIYQAAQNQMDRDIAAQNNDRQERIWNINRQDSLNQQERAYAEAEKDRGLQKEFAQHGIQWRVQDARAAGLHPLAALGAQLHSASPISVGGGGGGGGSVSFNSPTSSPISPFAGASMGSGIAAAGQDLGRALQAMSPESERVRQVAETQEGLKLQNMKLQNELLASQIAKTTAQVGPPMPTATGRRMIDGQGNTPTSMGRIKNNLVEEKKHEPVVGHPTQKESEPGEVTDVGYARTRGGYTPVPSKDVKERIEDSFLSEMLWEIRNRVPQTFGFRYSPPAHVSIKSDQRWWYNPLAQEYQIIGKPRQAPGRTEAVRSRNYLRTN